MSVQLILYPQGHDGTYNAFSNPLTDFITNGISFNNLNNAPSTATGSIVLSLISNPATIPNSWYRYARTATGSQFPTNVSNNLFIPSGIGTTSGVYQQITGITFGINYDIIIDIITPTQPATQGIIKIIVLSSTNTLSSIQNIAITQATTQITRQFDVSQWGQSGLTNCTVFVSYQESNTSSHNCKISQIQVQPSYGLGGSVLLDDGQVICDLYEEEDLPLTLSVDEFKNVAEKVQSYSKAFNLPATKRNNKIFDQVFEITRHLDGGSPMFNPYQKTQCVLKQDGFILFEGYLRMLDITDKEGEISYNVNLYSEVVALADYLGERTFNDLSFEELHHAYNKDNIKASWNNGTAVGQTTPINWNNPSTSGFRTDFNTLKYPFVNWNNQMLIANNFTGNAATQGNIELTMLEQAFRPWINIKYLIDIIFEGTPFTYTSTFLNRIDIGNLYMDFNWGGDVMPTEENTYMGLWRNIGVAPNIGNNSYKAIRLIPATVTGGHPDSTVPPNYQGDITQPNPFTLTATTTNEKYVINYNFEFENTSSPQASILGQFRWLHTSSTLGVQPDINKISHSIFFNKFRYNGYFEIILQPGDTLQAQFESSVDLKQADFPFTSVCNFVQSNATVTTLTLLSLRGETSQWEFLKGLITMFNLVTLPDETNPNNILIEPYADIFIENGLEPLNWTEKVDASQMKLTPLTDLNRKTVFKFVEDEDDSSFQQYKKQVNNHLYGSKDWDATNEFNILDGEEEIEAKPFAATVTKPIMSQYPSFIIPCIYAMDEELVSEGFDNSPRIMHNNGIVPTDSSYYMPDQNGLSSENQPDYLKFSHLTTASTWPPVNQLDFHFGWTQLLPGVGFGTLNNLFNLYWLPYFNELYNINTRTMVLKVNLSPSDISTFKFNSKVIIKNREFRVNKIDYQPNDLATVEFILIP